MPASPVDRAILSARVRLFAQSLLHRLPPALTAALVLGLGWLLVEPLLVRQPPAGLRWLVLIGLVDVALGAVLVVWIVRCPSKLTAALELDSRFQLRERVSTAFMLVEPLRSTPAGRAVLADAAAHTTGLRVREKVPLRLRPSAAWVSVP